MRKPKDPDGNRDRIIAAAAEEFAEHGLRGASMEAIAERTATSRGMINYYFGNKSGLYLAVLESVYRLNREAEAALDLETPAPLDALRMLVNFTFDYYSAHPEVVRLIAAENQAGGRVIRQSQSVKAWNQSALQRLGQLMSRGRQKAVFRHDISPGEVHMAISAMVFFAHFNRHTFGHSFGVDLSSKAGIERVRTLVTDAVLRLVAVPQPDAVAHLAF